MLLEIWNECCCKIIYMFLQTHVLIIPILSVFFFLATVGVRTSLRAPRLIPRGLEVNDYVNLQ
jgi:hypothetical protein